MAGAKLQTFAINTKHITDQAVTLPKINSTGAASYQFIGFDGSTVQWMYPNPTFSGVQVVDATTCNPCSVTVTDPNVRSIFIDGAYGGGDAARDFSNVTVNITIPAASAYADGSELSISINNYSAAPASLNIISPSSTIGGFNSSSANARMTSGAPIKSIGGKLVSYGSANKWFRPVE